MLEIHEKGWSFIGDSLGTGISINVRGNFFCGASLTIPALYDIGSDVDRRSRGFKDGVFRVAIT